MPANIGLNKGTHRLYSAHLNRVLDGSMITSSPHNARATSNYIYLNRLRTSNNIKNICSRGEISLLRL